MTKLSDGPGRLRALTDLGSTLLMEAAAGTGKTALMAGRLTMMLAEGFDPAHIAAITFTELAASEIAARVHRYVDELLAGRVPAPLRLALPKGLTDAQRTSLAAARDALDGLTASTIHGFCQDILRQYAAEADIDPGAEVLDADAADAALDAVFERWLRRRLSAPTLLPSDPVAVLSRSDPREVVATLRALAAFRRKHPAAHPLAADFSARPDLQLREAVSAFAQWAQDHPHEQGTAAAIDDLEILARHFDDAFSARPPFETLWRLVHPPRVSLMSRRESFDLKAPRHKSAWKSVAGKDQGPRLAEQAERLFSEADAAYRAAMGAAATAVVAILSEALDEVLTDYAGFKRAAAVLDFDDLLIRAARMLRVHEDVRRALGERYRHILVDEFQDTDPLQAEIIFRIASEEKGQAWQYAPTRPGALFLVGDPKQAIYQFRGANAGSYGQARAVIARQWPENIIQITANFRSRTPILTHINHCFDGPLSAPGQPGYVPLAPTIAQKPDEPPAVARLTLELTHNPGADEIREAEAGAVAVACARLIGNLKVRDEDNRLVSLTPGGIALLAPTGTDLWYYERALEERGLPVAPQAGKGLFHRQEVQDLVALTRVLADAADTLAFGALMRGPLVGLTEEELLDVTHALPKGDTGESSFFTVRTAPESVAHPVARHVLSILRALRAKASTTTPALLLAEAAELLSVRPILAAREHDRGARCAANVDVFIERARAYGVRGLRQLARDVTRDWKEGTPVKEGRVDADGDAVEIVTIHSAKGLEWPVVIPVNTATRFRKRDPFVHRPADDTVHWVVGDVVPPSLAIALDADEADAARERERLWYVACTRARDLLVIPDIPGANAKSWVRVVDLRRNDVPVLDLSVFSPAAVTPAPDPPNPQTPEIFAAEKAVIDRVSIPIRWRQPSRADPDRLPVEEAIAPEDSQAPETELPIGAGRMRGLLLHKLIEEVLTGETGDTQAQLATRATELMATLPLDEDAGGALPDAAEIAATVARTFSISEIAAMRPLLIAEMPLYASIGASRDALAGRADAIELRNGRVATIIDWKSDVAPAEQEIRVHAAQIREYMKAAHAPRGLIVYMTSGIVRAVEPA
jgi:CRISPR-associated exonuclease Cas4